ncbi:MAG: winged helix-turn-helix transcriptional regulator [Paracoccaceae bacterium]|nr:MAG: winged helix-turn-helix transcriptional regulator [Paracoccaceae bacterium]
MLFTSDILDQIATGRVTLAFRRWQRPSVRAGGTLRTPAGVLRIDSLTEIDASAISDAEARRAGFGSREALLSGLRGGKGRALYRIGFHVEGHDPRIALQHDADLSGPALQSLIDGLDTLDRASRSGPWTTNVLRLIAERQGTPSAEIARILGMDQPALKRRVRRLKDLGLTRSLHTGYTLSPRGARLWDALERRSQAAALPIRPGTG